MTTTSPTFLLVHVWVSSCRVCGAGLRARPVGWFRVPARSGREFAEGLLGDRPGVNRLALPVADLAFHLLLGPGDLRHDEARPQQPGGDETRHEAAQGPHAGCRQ